MFLKDIIRTWKNPIQFDSNFIIDKKDILKILEAGRWAPSAENQQVWRFLAIDDKIKKGDLIHSVEKQDPRLKAKTPDIKKPILNNRFVFSTDNFDAESDKYKDLISETSKDDLNCAKTASSFIIGTHSLKYAGKSFGWTDIGAAIANMILMTENLGFKARWIRNFNRETVRENLQIPKSLVIDALLAIGKSVKINESCEVENKNYEEFFFHNKWGNTIVKSDFESGVLDYKDYDVELVDPIVDRRSVRKYVENKEIPRGIIYELIKAGMMIPLVINKPYIKIILIDNKEILNRIAQHAKLVIQKQPHVQQVPLIIAITFDCTNNSPGFYAEYDTGAIIQSIILRAHSLGIGSCWIGAFSRKHVRKILNIEENWHLPSLAILGYPNKYPKPTPRVNLGKIGFYNEWKSGIEKRHRSIIPNYHIPSIAFRKIKKTRVKTVLRKRRVGVLIDIPGFES